MPGFGKSGTWRRWALRSMRSLGSGMRCGRAQSITAEPKNEKAARAGTGRRDPCGVGHIRLSIASQAPFSRQCEMRKSQKIDRIDLKILAALQEQDRMSNLELAAKAGLSASPCH